jgi:mono/diheme cytochrome c family protein
MKTAAVVGFLFVLTCLAMPAFGQMDGGMMGGEQGKMMAPEKTQDIGAKNIGAKIFNDQCSSCHPNGSNIIVPDLPIRGSRVLANFRTFIAFIRTPRMPDGSQGTMPAFGRSKISDQQARQLFHYVKSFEGYGTGGGYGMGPGMMGGSGYGMGRGTMGGGGYGMGRGMMNDYTFSPECQKFYAETAKLRKELHDTRFEYFETLRNPNATGESAMKLDEKIKELQEKIYAMAPLGCGW